MVPGSETLGRQCRYLLRAAVCSFLAAGRRSHHHPGTAPGRIGEACKPASTAASKAAPCACERIPPPLSIWPFVISSTLPLQSTASSSYLQVVCAVYLRPLCASGKP